MKKKKNELKKMFKEKRRQVKQADHVEVHPQNIKVLFFNKKFKIFSVKE
jgi:hypothetical protein